MGAIWIVLSVPYKPTSIFHFIVLRYNIPSPYQSPLTFVIDWSAMERPIFWQDHAKETWPSGTPRAWWRTMYLPVSRAKGLLHNWFMELPQTCWVLCVVPSQSILLCVIINFQARSFTNIWMRLSWCRPGIKLFLLNSPPCLLMTRSRNGTQWSPHVKPIIDNPTHTQSPSVVSRSLYLHPNSLIQLMRQLHWFKMSG